MRRIKVALVFFIVAVVITFFSVCVRMESVNRKCKSNDLILYYRGEVVDINMIDSLTCDKARGAPVIIDQYLLGLPAYVYDCSDQSCSVVIINDDSWYTGENVQLQAFELDDTRSEIGRWELIKKELIEYRDLPFGFLSKDEAKIRMGVDGIITLCAINFVLAVGYMIARKYSAKNIIISIACVIDVLNVVATIVEWCI